MNEKATTCPYCGVGCGVLVSPDGSGMDPVRGDPDHPANQGRLCIKGASLHETLGEQGRLKRPLVNGDEVSWEDALQAVAAGLDSTRKAHGGGAIAFYLSGQLLTEDYYVANKLAKGFIGTPHLDTNSRLCMASAVASYKRAFGEDVVPGCYEDLEQAQLIVFAGANPAWNHPVLYQRMKRALQQQAGKRVVVIDPRETASCELADCHLALKPGTDAILWNGLLVWLAERGGVDSGYVSAHCQGMDEALAAARASSPDPASVAQQCELDEQDVRTFYEWFRLTPRTVSFWSQGLNQSSSGTDKGSALINCHLATGRVGIPGASPFSITGQPNAMGGREVGGLANQLAAHMDYTTPGALQRVRDFWQAPSLAAEEGYKAVELFEAIHRGEVQAIWIMATNPLVSLPDSERVREALRQCPLVIVSDCVQDTDTLALADIVLPAQGWGEKDGTVTNSERCISRQRGALEPVGEAAPDWWILSRVADALGFGAWFDYGNPAQIFREHAALSALAPEAGLRFDISGLSGLTDQAYAQLSPIQWPVTDDPRVGTSRLFGDGCFATDDGRARFVPVSPRPPVESAHEWRPLRVNSGRIRDQWHTMTRTGRAPRLLHHYSEPFIEIHPADLDAFHIQGGALAWLENERGQFLGRVRPSKGQRRGEVFIPIHWSDSMSTSAVASRLFAAVTDPLSGQPESKHTHACLVPFQARWEARMLIRESTQTWPQDWFWARVPLQHCISWHLAGEAHPADWQAELYQRMGREPDAQLRDQTAGRYRAAWFEQGRLEAVMLVEPEGYFPELDWLDGCFSAQTLEDVDRRQILAGRAADAPQTGAIICSCYQVGEYAIDEAIQKGCHDVDALGEQLGCGTNCGSCIPELKKTLSGALPESREAAQAVSTATISCGGTR